MNITEHFMSLGGKFISKPELISEKLSSVKAFIFDWDGVFNNGEKQTNGSSNFSEIDSMGTNLLRFSYFLKNKKLPLTAIISGEKNETAFYFCERECFNYSFFRIPNKTDALKFICEKENIQPHEVAYFFDDVLDLSIAKICGVRVLVNRKANSLFLNFCIDNQLVDYLTAAESGNYAVREATELLIALNENFDSVINNRIDYTPDYASYIQNRRQVKTKFFTIKENVIEESK